MRRSLVGLLALLILLPALRARDDKDKPKDTPPTPAEQYQALVKEYSQAQRDYVKALNEAKTQEERQKVAQEKAPKVGKFAEGFLELARKNPTDAVTVDALTWILTYDGQPKDVDEAVEILMKDQVKSARMARVCQLLVNRNTPAAQKLLRAVLKENPSHDIQGTACLVLALQVHRKAQPTPDEEEKEKLTREANELSDQLVKEFMDVAQVEQVVLSPNSPLSTAALQKLAEKATDKNVQGKASYAVAQRYKQDAEKAAKDGKTAEADKANQEFERLLEKVAREYPDVEYGRRKLGAVAEGQLFEIRHLAIGKPVPEVEGEDLDGKKFKLSDYKGKVVLIDFWGNW